MRYMLLVRKRIGIFLREAVELCVEVIADWKFRIFMMYIDIKHWSLPCWHSKCGEKVTMIGPSRHILWCHCPLSLLFWAHFRSLFLYCFRRFLLQSIFISVNDWRSSVSWFSWPTYHWLDLRVQKVLLLVCCWTSLLVIVTTSKIKIAASSVFSLRAWQSSLTTSVQVLFGLSWSWTLYFILYAFLHPVIIFSQHMPIQTQPVLL